MGIFDIIGDIVEAPFRVAQLPTRAIKAVDEATLDTGAGKALDDVNEATVGEVGRKAKEIVSDLEDKA